MAYAPIPSFNMPPEFAAELAKIDPAIPFRASQSHIHYTWARTYFARPELYLKPKTLPEIQKVVNAARRLRRRLVVVGSGHSPSDLTCTSAWMVNLDDYNEVLNVDREKKRVMVQAGIRMRDLNVAAKEVGLTMPNLGSIDDQSIAGAIATATHGSSIFHGLLSASVKSLCLLLANGDVVRCSETESPELFRAALVSLGGLGIVVEVEFQMEESRDIEWIQTIVPIEEILTRWETDLWTQNEFVRVWWLPYMKRAIVWRADKTNKPHRKPNASWYGGALGYYVYHNLLWVAQYFPRILPTVEWFVFGMQYGFKPQTTGTAVGEQRTELLMDCLYSQFVNEWAIPLHRGPEAIRRLEAWINGNEAAAGIPFLQKGTYIHSPIEVRVTNTTKVSPRPYLDTSRSDTPTLYLNATLYRPYNQDPPCRERWYQAFEHLMREMEGRPHWAKNFTNVDHEYIQSVYGKDLEEWLKARSEVDPEGMFTGAWHRRFLLPGRTEFPVLPLEERKVVERKKRGGGLDWVGDQARW